MSKKVFVFLAPGFEEVEAIIPLDFLRRAGAQVTSIAVHTDRLVRGSHDIPIMADMLISEADETDGDCIVLPGGMPGSTNLAASEELDRIIRKYDAERKLVCAICAAPAVVLGSKGILDGRMFTCYPGAEANVRCGSGGCAEWSAEKVVVDEHLITSRGAGTAALFAVKIIEKLFDKTLAGKIAEQTLLHL
ncbi:MAG: DJ-1/PfpI family protein [Spirochaetaceae bacterium]|jgi:4-methyl-5(b-hydroxyethyl)-thiazole monophosphate biosynthesis|nr:DJ-1/PfpI family protein [Spirochaetaceae bacterium]